MSLLSTWRAREEVDRLVRGYGTDEGSSTLIDTWMGEIQVASEAPIVTPSSSSSVEGRGDEDPIAMEKEREAIRNLSQASGC